MSAAGMAVYAAGMVAWLFLNVRAFRMNRVAARARAAGRLDERSAALRASSAWFLAAAACSGIAFLASQVLR